MACKVSHIERGKLASLFVSACIFLTTTKLFFDEWFSRLLWWKKQKNKKLLFSLWAFSHARTHADSHAHAQGYFIYVPINANIFHNCQILPRKESKTMKYIVSLFCTPFYFLRIVVKFFLKQVLSVIRLKIIIINIIIYWSL